jgi:hypothetical protein
MPKLVKFLFCISLTTSMSNLFLNELIIEIALYEYGNRGRANYKRTSQALQNDCAIKILVFTAAVNLRTA